jgi:hypothetical protein
MGSLQLVEIENYEQRSGSNTSAQWISFNFTIKTIRQAITTGNTIISLTRLKKFRSMAQNGWIWLAI